MKINSIFLRKFGSTTLYFSVFFLRKFSSLLPLLSSFFLSILRFSSVNLLLFSPLFCLSSVSQMPLIATVNFLPRCSHPFSIFSLLDPPFLPLHATIYNKESNPSVAHNLQ